MAHSITYLSIYRINRGHGIIQEIFLLLRGIDCIAKANIAILLATITTSTAHTHTSRLQGKNKTWSIYCTVNKLFNTSLSASRQARHQPLVGVDIVTQPVLKGFVRRVARGLPWASRAAAKQYVSPHMQTEQHIYFHTFTTLHIYLFN